MNQIFIVLIRTPIRIISSFTDTIVLHEHNPEREACYSCIGASPGGIFLANGFSYVWPGFAFSLFFRGTMPLLLWYLFSKSLLIRNMALSWALRTEMVIMATLVLNLLCARYVPKSCNIWIHLILILPHFTFEGIKAQ